MRKGGAVGAATSYLGACTSSQHLPAHTQTAGPRAGRFASGWSTKVADQGLYRDLGSSGTLPVAQLAHLFVSAPPSATASQPRGSLSLIGVTAFDRRRSRFAAKPGMVSFAGEFGAPPISFLAEPCLEGLPFG